MGKDSKESSLTMFCRVSPDDTVLYCNSALALYLGIEKEMLTGASLEAINLRLSGEMADFFSRQAVTGSLNRLIVDEEGRIFEGSHTSDGLVLDLFLTEVTRAERVLEPFRSTIGYDQEELSEEEIRSILHPERRIISMLRTRTVGLEDLAATLPPAEIRILLNTFDEEMREAVLESGGSIGDVEAGKMEAMLGIPRYYQDHPLRTLRAVFNQFDRIAAIRKRLHRVGKQVPALAAGIASGEVLISPLTSPGFSRLSAAGPPALLCQKLCKLARAGEILLSQFSLTALLGCLPDGWGYMRAETEDAPDLADIDWEGDEVQALPESLERQVYLVGPGVEQHSDQTAFYFEYLYTVRCAGFDTPVPVLRVVRPEGAAGAVFEISDERLMQTPVAQVLGKYKLLSVVGVGGMGKVWKAQDRFGNTVAIKVLNKAEAASEESVRRFQREAEVMSRLPHRNICRVFEIGKFEGVEFISMEFVDGLTLADLLYEGLAENAGPKVEKEARLQELIQSLRVSRSVAISRGEQPIAETAQRPRHSRILPVAQTLSLFTKICEGVQFAHEHGILHRDLKPGNVLLREDGEPLVADFGLAKFEEENESSMSISGHIVGTIENMAPEQAESSKDVDERADVYSLGTILYQMLTGHRHFDSSGNIIQDAQTLKTHQPVRPRQLNPTVDADLELICMKALRPVPSERYRTVSAMLADINRYRRGEVIKARPVSGMDVLRKAMHRHRALVAAIAVAGLVLAALAVVAVYQINQERIAAEEHASRAEEQARRAEEEARRAEMLRVEADQLRVEAERRQQDVEATLAELRKAREETVTEAQSRQKAEAESEKERLAREEAEKKVAQLNRTNLELEAAATEAALNRNNDGEVASGQQQQLETARSIFADRIQLRRIDLEDPEVLSELILAGLDASSRAVQQEPSNPEAHLLRGIYHLVSHEPEQALASLRQAREQGPESSVFAEKARLLNRVISRQVEQLGEFSPESVAEAIRTLSTREFEKLASLILAALPHRDPYRVKTIGEALLAIQDSNPEIRGNISLVQESYGTVARVERSEQLADFAPLAELPVEGLHLIAPKYVDWNVLSQMNLRGLILENANAQALPAMMPGDLSNLRFLSLRGTPVADLRFLAPLSNLQKLDLTDTGVRDITGIHNRNLISLNLTGCEPMNLVTITRLNLQELILDPATAANESQTIILRRRSTPSILRIEGDPPSQTLGEFFRRQDAGEYRKKSAEDSSGD